MAPKKRRNVGESSRQGTGDNVRTPPIVTTGIPRFVNREDRDQYNRLQGRALFPTKFPDMQAMNTLGIFEHVRWLLGNIGLDWLLLGSHPTYERVTYEFLASLRHQHVDFEEEEDHPGLITFQLFDQQRQWTLEQFNQCLHFPTDGTQGIHDEFDANQFWNSITGLGAFVVKVAKSTAIQNPVFRYVHRVLSNTFFARGESSGAVRLAELHLLWCMVYQRQPNLGLLLWQGLLKISHGDKGAITIGGLLTPIAHSITTNIEDPPIEGPSSIDLQLCQQMGMIRRYDAHRYQLLLRDKVESLVLPHPLTNVQLEGNWLYASYSHGRHQPPVHFEHIELDYQGQEQPQAEQQGGEDIVQPPPVTLQSLSQRMDQMYARQDEMLEYQRRQQQMMDAMINWHVSQGHFPYPPPQ